MGDYRTTTGEKHPLTPRERSQRRRVGLLAGAVLLIIAGVAGAVISVPRCVTASGYVTTREYAEVRPAVAGGVAEILARTGDRVEKGDLLVRLDTSQEQAQLEEARSRVSQAEAEIARRRADIDQRLRKLDEDIDIARLRLKNAHTKRRRTEELLQKGLVAGNTLEDMELREELAKAELMSLIRRDRSVFDKELRVLKENLRARRDAVNRAEAQLRTKEIRAPISGEVLRYEFVIGELVRPESVLYEIFGGEDQVLKLRIPERHATRVAAGQRYRAELASFRGLNEIEFQGQVRNLRNVIQADGQKTYRVAYCSFDSRNHSIPPGTTAEARIYYGRSCLWFFLFGID